MNNADRPFFPFGMLVKPKFTTRQQEINQLKLRGCIIEKAKFTKRVLLHALEFKNL